MTVTTHNVYARIELDDHDDLTENLDWLLHNCSIVKLTFKMDSDFADQTSRNNFQASYAAFQRRETRDVYQKFRQDKCDSAMWMKRES